MTEQERGRLIVISGPSGVGKGTLLARYLERHPKTRVSVSATTRSPRPGEIDGVHYTYITCEEFLKKISSGGMLEWAQYNNHYYGTPREPVEAALAGGTDVVLEIEVQGALNVRRSFPGAVLVFVMPPDFETLRSRLVGRGTEDAQTVRNRLRTAVDEMNQAGEYDFILVNDDLESAADALERALAAVKYLTRSNKPLLLEVLEDAQTYFVAD